MWVQLALTSHLRQPLSAVCQHRSDQFLALHINSGLRACHQAKCEHSHFPFRVDKARILIQAVSPIMSEAKRFRRVLSDMITWQVACRCGSGVCSGAAGDTFPQKKIFNSCMEPGPIVRPLAAKCRLENLLILPSTSNVSLSDEIGK